MKILVVALSNSRAGGGVAEVMRLTVAALRRRFPGVAVEVAVCRDNYTETDLPLYADTPVHVFRTWWSRRFRFSPGLMFHLLRARPDVVHVHALWGFHAAAVLTWSTFTGLPYVVTPHGMLEGWILRRSPRLKAMVGAVFHDAFLRRAHCFQALTVKEVGDIRAFAPGAECRVIPNCVPATDAPAEKPGWWHDKLAGRDIYLFFGRIHPQKGVIELLRAWDEACSRNGRFRDTGALVVCGWNDGLAQFGTVLEQVAARHGNVIFGGAQFGEDRRRSLQSATFMVLPSRSEGLPMVILEGWAAGKPALMTSECNLPIGFERGAALRIEADVPRLASGLLAAHALDAAQRASMQRRAVDLVAAEFSPAGVADALMDMYCDAIGRHRSRSIDAVCVPSARDQEADCS
jgi:glycosyltransferase involved in cell wall biosynthesis